MEKQAIYDYEYQNITIAILSHNSTIFTRDKMPKEKKRGPSTGNTQRHAPLGQVITDDENRSKYATVRSRQRQESDRKNKKYQEEDLLDEKTTQKIFELSKEQMLEIEMEEQRERELMRKKTVGSARGDDSEDDEDDGDDGNISAMGEILDDEEDE